MADVKVSDMDRNFESEKNLSENMKVTITAEGNEKSKGELLYCTTGCQFFCETDLGGSRCTLFDAKLKEVNEAVDTLRHRDCLKTFGK